MGREFEVKYRASAQQLEAVLAAYPGGTRIGMETVYYEVPSGVLAQRHWTVRRRMENGISVCTVKTPCPDGGRGEWELSCPEINAAIPGLIAMGAPAELESLAKEGFYPLCGARFVRIAVPVRFGSSLLELAADRGVLLGGSLEEPLCEIEAELKEGRDEDAAAFGAFLAHSFGIVPEPKSKFARAKALAKRISAD